jgi:YspA, cpYpsA-related SLOG family
MTLAGKRILVCGGREFTDYQLVCQTLDGLFPASPPSDTVIVHGDALGADRLADQWGARQGTEGRALPGRLGEARTCRGPIRNKQMLEEGKPDLVVAVALARSKSHRGLSSGLDLATSSRRAGGDDIGSPRRDDLRRVHRTAPRQVDIVRLADSLRGHCAPRYNPGTCSGPSRAC